MAGRPSSRARASLEKSFSATSLGNWEVPSAWGVTSLVRCCFTNRAGIASRVLGRCSVRSLTCVHGLVLCGTGTRAAQRRWYVVEALVEAVVAVGGAVEDDQVGGERERSSAATLEEGELVVYAVTGDTVHELAREGGAADQGKEGAAQAGPAKYEHARAGE